MKLHCNNNVTRSDIMEAAEISAIKAGHGPVYVEETGRGQ